MVRHFSICLLALIAATAFTAARPCAASQQSDELKQIKADLKVGLSQAKDGIDNAMIVFNEDLNILLIKMDIGSVAFTNVADELAAAVLKAVAAIENANRDAVNDTAQQVALHATVTLANNTLPGGGGDFDKLQAAQNALAAKALKKMQGLLKKFQKSAVSAGSVQVRVNVLLLPFQSVQNIASDHDTGAGVNLLATSTVAVLIGTSAGNAIVGGLASGLCTTTVTINSASTDLTSSGQLWSLKKTSLTPGNVATFSFTDPSPIDAIFGVFSIGIPTL